MSQALTGPYIVSQKEEKKCFTLFTEGLLFFSFFPLKHGGDLSMHGKYCFTYSSYTMREYSDVTCHLVLLYSVDWTKAGISFIFPRVNLFCNYTLTECGLYSTG